MVVIRYTKILSVNKTVADSITVETCKEKSIGKMNKVEKRSKGKNDIAKLTFEGSIQTPDEYVPETTINVRSKTP